MVVIEVGVHIPLRVCIEYLLRVCVEYFGIVKTYFFTLWFGFRYLYFGLGSDCIFYEVKQF